MANVARATLCLTLGGCMSLTPQLEPTDFVRLEQTQSRRDREQAFKDNTIYRHQEPQGTRYTKGNLDAAPKRSWQSLDAILRSDQNSSAALPAKQLRRSRVFTALAIASSILFVAGVAATAREGFDFKKPSAGNATLLGGALGSVAFAVIAGVLFRRASKGYDRAVDVYNDSLGVRLGVMTPGGEYIPPADVMVDSEGYIITEDRLPPGTEGPARMAPLGQPATRPGAAQPGAAQPSAAQPGLTQPGAAQPDTTPPVAAPPVAAPPVAAPPVAAPPVAAPAPVVPAAQPGPIVPAPRHVQRSAPSGPPASPQLAPRRDAPVGALTLLPQR